MASRSDNRQSAGGKRVEAEDFGAHLGWLCGNSRQPLSRQDFERLMWCINANNILVMDFFPPFLLVYGHGISGNFRPLLRSTHHGTALLLFILVHNKPFAPTPPACLIRLLLLQMRQARNFFSILSARFFFCHSPPLVRSVKLFPFLISIMPSLFFLSAHPRHTRPAQLIRFSLSPFWLSHTTLGGLNGEKKLFFSPSFRSPWCSLSSQWMFI